MRRSRSALRLLGLLGLLAGCEGGEGGALDGGSQIFADAQSPIDVGGEIPSDAGEARDGGAEPLLDGGTEPLLDGGTLDAGASDAGAPILGTWLNPIEIQALPFGFDGDTRVAPSDQADVYTPCAPAIDESGGEYVFRLTIGRTLTVAAYVDDVAGDQVDIDVHLLSAPSPDSCLDRDNIRIERALGPGVYYLVTDTWVNGGQVPLSGAFHLVVEETTGASDCLTNPITCVETDTPLVNGVPAEPAGTGGCPDGMALVASTFCVDRYEAALVLVNGDQTLSPWSPYANPGANRVRAISAPGLVPQGYLSQVQAANACAEAGKRLCTDAEWLRACQGSASTTYPYGNVRLPGACNDARTCHPVIQYFETNASWIWSELGHPCINQLPDGLAPTGAHTGCVSEDGIFDMMGNLHEWTSDPAGTFRGGFYVDTVVNGQGCLYRTTAHNASYWDYSTGFRCCADL